MDNTYGLLRLQEANLRMLVEIDRICSKYKIEYFLDSGTLLGAIRHGGFIPWDDDVDIVMKREHYEKFKKIAKKELSEGMSLLLPTGFVKGNAFYDFTPRIIYEKSRRYIPNSESMYYEEKLNHLWVDIFILDSLPEKKFAAKRVILWHKFIYLMAMGHRHGIEYKKYPMYQRPIILFFTLLGRMIPMRFLFRLQNIVARAVNKKPSSWFYYSNYQPDYLDVKLKKEWLENAIQIQFEEKLLQIPEEYDEVLKAIYGDYMKLPEKSARVPSHGSQEIEIYE